MTGRRSVALVLGLVGVTTAALVLAAPAGATQYGGPDCDLPRVQTVPHSGTNAAPVARADSAVVSEGRGVSIDVLRNDSDPDPGDSLQLIGTSAPSAGTACVTDDGDVYYYSLGAPADGTDSFSYSISDGDFYRTATVTVSVTPTAVTPPQVTTKRLTSSGSVTRKGEVRVTNPDPEHTVVFYAGAAGSPDRDIHRTIVPGASTVVATSRARLDYEITALGDQGSQQDYVGLLAGRIDSDSGAVTAAAEPVDTTVPNDGLDLSACDGFVESRAGTGAAPAPVDDTASSSEGAPATFDVLANDTDPDGDPLTVVATGPARHGLTCASGSDVYYLNINQDVRSDATDGFTYAVTDGNRIRSASVGLTIDPVRSTVPTVTRRIQLSGGHVVRKGQVTVTNTDPVHEIVFRGGGTAQGPFDIARHVAPGARTVVDTSRSRLYFRTAAVIGDRYENVEDDQIRGFVDTTTGKVSITYRRYPSAPAGASRSR